MTTSVVISFELSKKEVVKIGKLLDDIKCLAGDNCKDEIEQIRNATNRLDACIEELEHLHNASKE